MRAARAGDPPPAAAYGAEAREIGTKFVRAAAERCGRAGTIPSNMRRHPHLEIRHVTASRLFLAAALLAASVVVHAHTKLHASTPADGAVLTQAPAALALEFTGEVRLMSLRLSGADGVDVPLELPAAAQQARRFDVPLPTLPAQRYTVEWTVMGGDTHRAAGSFGFDVGAATP